jgi:virulence-associated protein VagC
MVIDALPGRVFMSGNSQAACIPVEFRLSREAQLA